MKSKQILILGSKGMLGSDLVYVFRDLKPRAWDKEEIDITDKNQVFREIKKMNPEVIINAAAYTNVEEAEKEFKLAKKINALAVKYLAEVGAEIGAVFVHYSTDYVFSGRKKIGYGENEIPKNPVNKYGLSKLLGEQAILNLKSQKSNLKFYLIRTSWLFGSRIEPQKHKNFVTTILKLAQEKKEIKVINDQFGKPTYTLDLARATRKLLENKKTFGIYHLINAGSTTWYKFAKGIIKLSKLKADILPCKTSEYQTLAKRPKYSMLVNTKLPRLRHWKEALKEYLYRTNKNKK